jgi:hypothetical protein
MLSIVNAVENFLENLDHAIIANVFINNKHTQPFVLITGPARFEEIFASDRTVHIHPTVAEYLPTVLSKLEPFA